MMSWGREVHAEWVRTKVEYISRSHFSLPGSLQNVGRGSKWPVRMAHLQASRGANAQAVRASLAAGSLQSVREVSLCEVRRGDGYYVSNLPVSREPSGLLVIIFD
jgi:hypothetical protein